MKIVVLAGGTSTEREISIVSGTGICKALRERGHQAILVDVYCGNENLDPVTAFDGEYDVDAAAAYMRSFDSKIKEMQASGKEFFGPKVLELCKAADVVFLGLHGKNGEDGTVQGLLELAGIPVVGCGTVASALCMDKDRAHKLASLAGVAVPASLVLNLGEDPQAAVDFARQTGYPLFVKPVKAGSSYGISQIHQEEELRPALDLAFQYDNQVILEETIPGFEVGCAVIGTRELLVGEIDEIELSGGFFDFTEKYTLKTSAIHVPARVDPQTAQAVKQTAKVLYRALGCAGFARVDLFLTPQGKIVFNEINTIPGFTEHSRFPGMMQAAGMTFPEILDTILGQVMAP